MACAKATRAVFHPEREDGFNFLADQFGGMSPLLGDPAIYAPR
jgi:hypothetical protein